MTLLAKILNQLVLVVLLTCLPLLTFAQCECTDCPIFLASNSTASSTIDISGATSNMLGQSGQQLCRVCIDFSTDAIKELTFELTAPDGSSILLFEDSGININSNMEFDICFVSCVESADPDAGHDEVFDTNDNWESNTSFNGDYYPFVGCLEDLTGTVDGSWTLNMEDDTFLDDSDLHDWYLVFTNDLGLGCANASDCNLIVCDADAGTIEVTNSPACPAETVSFTVTGNNTDPAYGNLIFIVDDSGTIIELFMGTTADYNYGYCGDFTAYSYNYDIASVTVIPHEGDLIDDIDCNTDCCDLSEIPFSYEDLTNPFFTYLPPHPALDLMTGMLEPVYCIDDLPEAENAEFDDNCIGEGISEVMITDLSDFCDGGLLFWSWALMDSCDNSGTLLNEVIITIEPAPEANFVDPPADYTTDCNNIPTSGPMLTYTNGQANSCLIEGGAAPVIEDNTTVCGGEILMIWSDVDVCGRTVEHIQTITVEPPPDPYFVDPPADMNITCDQIPVTTPTLLLTNDESGICQIEEEIVAEVEDNYNGCSGTIIYTWEYMSDCGVSLEHMQTLTMIPPPLAAFVNPPGSDILPCDELSILSTTLEYSNGETGDCKIEDSVEAIVVGSINACGGPISYLWEFTDDCGRTISHTQNITILASADPVFIDVPDDITLSCQETYDPDPLLYDNGVNGSCGIFGTSLPTTSQIDNVITVSWMHTLCDGSEISASQTVTLLDDPIIEVTPSNLSICQGESYNLADLNIDQMGLSGGAVTYHTDIPPTAANELGSSIVTPSEDANFVILVTFPDGCQAYDNVTVIVDTQIISAESGVEIICDQSVIYNLFEVLNNVTTTNGSWLDLDDSGVDLLDPTNVDFSGLMIGEYQYQYTGVSTNSCLPDIAIATIIIGEQVVLNTETIDCAMDELSYNVQIETNENVDIFASQGMINILNDSVYQIVNIPIDSAVLINGFGLNLICNDSLSIMPPDCSCPDVETPTAIANSICPHEAPATIMATVASGLTANWYDVAIGGLPLATGVTEYSPNDTAPGIYIYYVESMDANGCTSSTRTAVWFTIFAPVAEDTLSLFSCINFENQESDFALLDIYQLLESSVSAPLPWMIGIHNSYDDAVNEIDELLQDITLENADDKTIFARVTDDNGCFGIVPISLSPLEYPEAVLEITNEVCDGGSDGIVELNFSQDSVLSALDNFDFEYENIYNDLSAGPHMLSLLDSNMCTNQLSFEIEMGYTISLNLIDFMCFGNDTNEDESDDFWTFTFDASTNSGSLDYSLLIDGEEIDTYNFDQEYSLDIIADDLVHTILFVDNITGCNLPISTPLLTPCSSPCTAFPDASINLDVGPILNCQISEISASSVLEDNIVYTWIFNGQMIDPTELIMQPGELSLLAIDTITGCIADSMIIIESIVNDPMIIINPPDILSCEDDEIILDASMSDSGDNMIYQWSDEDGNMIGSDSEFLEVSSGGWYYLELTNSENYCVSIDSVLVEEDGDRPIIDLDDVIIGECGKEVDSLDALISNAVNYSITWTTQEGDVLGSNLISSIAIQGEGVYYISVVNEDNLCVSVDSVTYELEPNPSLENLIVTNIYCDSIVDAHLQLGQVSGTAPYEYYIDGSLMDMSDIALESGTYSLEIIDANGCEVDSMITIEAVADLEIQLAAEIEFIEGMENNLDASVNLPLNEIVSIFWSPSENLSCSDCLAPSVLSPNNEIYSVVIEDINGCEAMASIEVQYEEIELTPIIDFVIPNIFSPNGDGINDYFFIRIPAEVRLDNLAIYVFDRWGEQVYFAEQLHIAAESEFWDGSFNGKSINPGVFVYYAKAIVTETGEEIIFYGDVTLIR